VLAGTLTAQMRSNAPVKRRAFCGPIVPPVSAGLICKIALVKQFNSIANGRAATFAVSVRGVAAQRVRLVTSPG
jgi:hypothetical protein